MLPYDYFVYFTIATGLILLNLAAHGALNTESKAIKSGLGVTMRTLIIINTVVTDTVIISWVLYALDAVMSYLAFIHPFVDLMSRILNWFTDLCISPYIWSTNSVLLLELCSSLVLWVLFGIHNQVEFGSWWPDYYQWRGYRYVSSRESRALGISVHNGWWPLRMVKLPPLDVRARKRADQPMLGMAAFPIEWKTSKGSKGKSGSEMPDFGKMIEEGGAYVLVFILCVLLFVGVVLGVNSYLRMWDEFLAIPNLETSAE